MNARENTRHAYDAWHEQMGRSDGDSPLAHPWYQSVANELTRIAGGRLLEIGYDFWLVPLAGTTPTLAGPPAALDSVP